MLANKGARLFGLVRALVMGPLLAARYWLLMIAAVVVALALLAPDKAQTADVAPKLQGEDFSGQPAGSVIVTGAANDGGAALKFTANGTATHTVNCSATCDVTLWAKAGQTGGSPSFSVNGSPPQAITTGTAAPYTFDVNLPAGSTELRVSASNVGTGRNAFLDYVTFPASDGGPPPPAPQCSDGQDNDGDGQTDFPNDPGCADANDNDETNAPPPPPPPPPPPEAGRIVGAGDIATSGSMDTATANLILERPDARVFTAGDNAYPDGAASDFTNKYHPAWGPFKNRTSPSPGNHEYRTSGASGYKNYFGSVAGFRSVNPTYYAYTLGAWRVYALDSNISMAIGSPQYNFVQNDLASNGALCELAYWHHPIASSGQHGNIAVARPICALFDAQGGDLVLNGHDHNYERFKKINSLGQISDSGVRQIIVGTGGTSLRGEGFVQPGSEVRNSADDFNTHGIVDINLSSTGYSGTFVPVPGKTFTDSFSGMCGTT